MESLIRFDALRVDANQAPAPAAQTETFPSAQVIDQLRHRLISPDYRDPVEVKIAVLSDLICACHHQLMKRREL
jgi:hypothetical protein